jgi:hypothetical protein
VSNNFKNVFNSHQFCCWALVVQCEGYIFGLNWKTADWKMVWTQLKGRLRRLEQGGSKVL